MNWIAKCRNGIKSKIKRYKDNEELKKSNWGRDFGWFIELDGKNVGELANNKFEDMFWVSYKVIAYHGYEEVILDSENWLKCRFKFVNKHYLQSADGAFCGGTGIYEIGEEHKVSMRALYLESIEEPSLRKNDNR